MRLINVVCLLFIFAGCNQKSTTHTERELVPEPDRKMRLKYQKATIDSSRMTKALSARVYAKEPGSASPTEVLDLKWPKAIDEVYNVWYNDSNQVVCIGSYPFSQSGDWDLGFTHYFDKNGNTFAFERNTSFYNSLCTDDLAIEQIVTYYHNNMMVDSVYVFTDVKGKNLEKDSCEFPYDFPYRVYTNANDVLRNVGIIGNENNRN